MKTNMLNVSALSYEGGKIYAGTNLIWEIPEGTQVADLGLIATADNGQTFVMSLSTREPLAVQFA